MLIPMAATERRILGHVRIEPPDGGVRRTSFIKCQDIRSASTDRLVARWGSVSAAVMKEIEVSLRVLLQLGDSR